MKLLAIGNCGPLIVSTNYWDSEVEGAGKFYLSVNAGAVRILVPRNATLVVEEWRTAAYVILSRGPWPKMQIDEAIELLFEDHTDSPFVLHLTSNSFDLLPGEPEPGKEWKFSAWVLKDDAPHKVLERPVRWRRVARIPDLSKWNDEV